MRNVKKTLVVGGFSLVFAANAQATPFVDVLAAFAPGAGFGVYDFSGGAYLGASGAGVVDPLSIFALDGAGLALGGASGVPGSAEVGFSTGSVVDLPGADIRFYDTFGLGEGFVLDAWSGAAWIGVGTFPGSFTGGCSLGTPCITDVDIAPSGLASASMFRITAHQPTSVFLFPEAYDLDTVEALHFASSVPVPGTLALLGMGLGLFAAQRRRAS